MKPDKAKLETKYKTKTTKGGAPEIEQLPAVLKALGSISSIETNQSVSQSL